MRARHAAVPDARRRGGILLASLVLVMVLSGVMVSVFTVSLAQKNEVNRSTGELRALYLADAAITDCLAGIAISEETGADKPTEVGTQAAPVVMNGGRYWASITDNGDESFTVQATGSAGLMRRRVDAVVAPVGGGIYDHAVFAGNSGGAAGYTLELGGVGGQADVIDGDIFSGGDIDVTGDATVTGEINAGGTVFGALGHNGVQRPTPDIAGMDYANNNDFDVAAMFAAASWQSSSAGGNAYQLPETSPAHIFRKDPDDRTDETSSTTKSDYFLEDPYESITGFTFPNGKSGQEITLSGTMGEPGVSGTDKVYFIDGNLWVHNKPSGRFMFSNTDAEGAKVTFVVKGNIYFSDDIYIADEDTDGVAFVAINDPAEADSGNVYFGDPRYGTLEYMQSWIYAENDFYDNNLDASGSKTVTIKGNMTAGNHVAISRDFVDGSGNVEHSKLTVDFDDRLSNGTIELPGLPRMDGGIEGFEVAMWRVVSE